MICQRPAHKARDSSFEINKSSVKRSIKVLRFVDLLEMLALSEEKLKEKAASADEYIEALKHGKSID